MIELAEDATEAEAYEVADAWLRRNLPGDALKAALDADWATVAAFLADPERGPAWHSALGAAGLSTPTWPKEWGGLGLSARAAGAVAEAVLRYRVDRGMSDFVGSPSPGRRSSSTGRRSRSGASSARSHAASTAGASCSASPAAPDLAGL